MAVRSRVCSQAPNKIEQSLGGPTPMDVDSLYGDMENTVKTSWMLMKYGEVKGFSIAARRFASRRSAAGHRWMDALCKNNSLAR